MVKLGNISNTTQSNDRLPQNSDSGRRQDKTSNTTQLVESTEQVKQGT